MRRLLENRFIEPTLCIGPHTLKKLDNACTVPLGNVKFSFKLRMYVFENIRKMVNSIKYIGKAIWGVIASINEFAKILGTVIKRYRNVPIIVSIKGGSFIPRVLVFFSGSYDLNSLCWRSMNAEDVIARVNKDIANDNFWVIPKMGELIRENFETDHQLEYKMIVVCVYF